ncbi:MAG: hypothetical protein J6D27_00940 [Ruminiclostridium sp.]|nr:hypothetical protein [Ruminiclostridium sp.]
MKKTLILLIALSLALSFNISSCQQNTQTSSAVTTPSTPQPESSAASTPQPESSAASDSESEEDSDTPIFMTGIADIDGVGEKD